MIQLHQGPAVITDPRTGMIRWMNPAAREFFEIPPDCNIEKTAIEQFYLFGSERKRLIQHLMKHGFDVPLIIGVKTVRERPYAVKMRGRLISAIYPSVFKIIESYRRLELPEW